MSNIMTLRKRTWRQRIAKDYLLYLLLIPGVSYFIIFRYIPILGLTIAFKNYIPYLGFSGSKWVGFANFTRFFSEPHFWQLLKNTLLIGLVSLLFYFPVPIIIALLLNEVRNQKYKMTIQTLVYIPHFMSWIVIYSITYAFLTTEGGIINGLLTHLGFEKIPFMMSSKWFRPIVVIQQIWKEAGWGTIILLATLAGINPELYESASIDGANRWQQLVFITLPSLSGTISILLLLRLGRFLNIGFEQILMLLNAMNREVGEIFDTYIYQVGIGQGQYSYTTAIGIFKGLIAAVLVVVVNRIVKKLGHEGLF